MSRDFSIFLILAIIILFSPLWEGGTTYFPLTIIKLLTLMAVATYLVKSLIVGKIEFKKTYLDKFIIIFLSIAFITTLISPYKSISFKWFYFIVNGVIIYYLSILCIKSISNIWQLFYIILFSAFIQTSSAFVQILLNPGGRVAGTFFNPNFLAGYLAAILGVIGGIILFFPTSFYKENQNAKKPFLKLSSPLIIFILSFILIFITLILTQSRGGGIAFLVSFLFLFFLKFRIKALIILPILLLIFLIIPNPLKNRLMNISKSDIYAYERISVWKESIKMLGENPWGTGLGIYKYSFLKHRIPNDKAIFRYKKKAVKAHNEYLQLGVETGIAGLTVFLIFIFLILKKAFRAISYAQISQKGLIIGITAGIISILVHSLLDANLHQFPIVLLFSLYISFIMILSENTKKVEYTFTYKKHYIYLVIILLFLTAFFVIRDGLGYFYFMKGDSYSNQRKLTKAADNYRMAIFFDPGNTRYHKALIYSVWFNHKIKAIKRCSEALRGVNLAQKIDSADPEIRAIKGRLYYSLSNLSKNKIKRSENLKYAIFAFKDALKIDPYNPFYRNELGFCYFFSENYNKAEEEFLKIVKLEPNFLPSRNYLGNIYEKKGELNKAIYEYKKVLNIKKKYQNKKLHDNWDRRFLNVDTKIIMEKISILEK
jgi:O-antigen ligase